MYQICHALIKCCTRFVTYQVCRAKHLVQYCKEQIWYTTQLIQNEPILYQICHITELCNTLGVAPLTEVSMQQVCHISICIRFVTVVFGTNLLQTILQQFCHVPDMSQFSLHQVCHSLSGTNLILYVLSCTSFVTHRLCHTSERDIPGTSEFCTTFVTHQVCHATHLVRPRSSSLRIRFTYFSCLKPEDKKLKTLSRAQYRIDDLRPALGCYGSENSVTPSVDNLAKRSIIFNNAYAQQALCAPSRNSLLTSRRPDTLHLYDFYNYWRNFTGNFTTLPQHFKENGYHTHSIGKVFHPGISSNWNDDQPFSWSEQPYHPPTEKYKEAPVCIGKHGNLERDLVCPVVTEFQPEKSLPDLQSLKAAQEFLHRKKDNSQPFFLAVGFHKPHVPIKFPYRYLDFHPIDKISLPKNRWRPALLPTVAWNPWTDVRDRDDIATLNISFPFGVMPDRYSKLIRQSYFAAVTYIDDLLGQLLDTLSASGHENDTIIILIGDHGWSLGEHGEWSKYSNFEISVKVPFLLCIPGLTTSGKSSKSYLITDALVELVDIFPTLIDITSVSAIPPLCLHNSSHIKLCTEGISLLPLIEHEIHQVSASKPSVRNWKTGVFSQYPRPDVFPVVHPNSDKPRLKDIKIMGYSLRTPKYRYTEWVHFNIKTFQADWSQLYGQELYDHDLDHDENFNLIERPELKGVIRILQHQLHAGWKYSLPKHSINTL